MAGKCFRQFNANLNAIYTVPMGTIQAHGLVGAGWGREWHGDRSFNGTRHGNLIVNTGLGAAFPVLGVVGFIEAR